VGSSIESALPDLGFRTEPTWESTKESKEMLKA
jgi:hypothetical protein